MSPLVFVTVGTDFHPFQRVIEWMDRWAELRGIDPDRCLVQYGSSDAPRHCTGHAFLPQDKLRTAFAVADVVVCHGGPATIAEARAAGVLPICVPRDPGRGEHVDAHQLRFARRVSRDGVVILAEQEQELFAALDRAFASPQSVAMDVLWPAETTWPAAVDQVGGLIEGLLARSGRGRRF